MVAVSAGQLREFRTRVETAIGRRLVGVGEEIVMALAMLDEDTLKTLAPLHDTTDFAKLANVLREEPALIQLLKVEKRLPTLLALMKTASADELKFAILRANAHEAGVAAANTERLVHVLREAGVSAEVATTWGSKTFTRLASDATRLGELEKTLPLVKSGKITGLQDWLQYTGTRQGNDIANTVAELSGARITAAQNPSATVDVGSDANAPKIPRIQTRSCPRSTIP